MYMKGNGRKAVTVSPHLATYIHEKPKCIRKAGGSEESVKMKNAAIDIAATGENI